jgi:hypothetical protein
MLVSVEGYLDRCDSSLIKGWVLFTEDPARKAKLEIYAGTRLLGRCVADQRRHDLVEAGLGDCMFQFIPPQGLPKSDLERVEIRIVDTEFLLCAGPHGLLRDPPAAVGYAEGPKPAKRFPVCFLHIGTEHTGATSLQRFFALNRQAFAKAGYFIPQSLAPHDRRGIFNHIHLVTYAMDDTRFEDGMRASVGVHDADSLQRYRTSVQSSFEDEIAKLNANCNAMILSCEYCQSQLCSEREIQRLKEFLDPFCDHYAIVVYLRPQHELAMSLYGMTIANGVLDIDTSPPMPPPPDYSEPIYTDRQYFDYNALLLTWSSVFGKEAIIPRLYIEEHLSNGYIIDDFMSHVPLVSGSLIRFKKMNNSASKTAQKFPINLNRHFDDSTPPGAERVRERTRNALRARFQGRGIAPARAAVAELLDQFRQSNEQVRLRWFPDRARLFDVDLSQFPETESPTS